jgi:hypothetical protein
MALNVLNTLLNQLNSGSYVYGGAGTAYRSGLLTENEFTVFQNNFNEYTGTQPGERPYSKGDVITGAYGEEPEEESVLEEKEKECPEGFYFDKTLGMCVLEEEVTTPVEPSPEPETEPEDDSGQSGGRLYPYVYTRRTDDLNTGQSRGPLDGLSVEMLTEEELADRFAQDTYAQKSFGSFDNYLGYLDNLLNLAEEHPEIAWWEGYAFRNLVDSNQALADFYNLEDEDARSGSGARIDAEAANLAAANAAFEAMLALPEYQQLVIDRGLETKFVLGKGDVYVFNGLTATEIHEGDDTFGSFFEFAMRLANRLTLGYVTGATVNALGLGKSVAAAFNLSETSATIIASAIDAAVAQVGTSLISGESVDLDLKSIIASAVASGLLDTATAESILSQLPSTGIAAFDAAIREGVVNSATQLALNGEIDLDTLTQAMLRAGLSNEFDELLNQIKEAAGLEGQAFEDFLKELQERFPNVDPSFLENAIRDLADQLDTSEIEDVLSSIADRAGQGWEDFTQYLEDSGYTIEDFDLFESVLSTLGKAIPNSWDDVKTLFKSIIDGMNPFSTDCRSSTPREGIDIETGLPTIFQDPYYIEQSPEGHTVAGGWNGPSVVYRNARISRQNPGGVADVYPGWMDCVNLRGLLEIPFLDIPLPPGLTDISIADLRKAVMSAGDSFEDFLGDPGAWLEEKIQDIIGGITEPFENSDALLEYLGTILGGVLAGALYDEIKERLEGEVPDLFLPFAPEEEGNDCQVEVEGELTAGTVTGGECIPLSPQDQQERCDTDQVFADANPEICGEGLSGEQTENNRKCEKDYGVGYYYDTELEQCVELTAGTDPIRDPDEDKKDLDSELTEDYEAKCRKLGKFYDPDKKECVDGPPVTTDPPTPDFGMCDDGVTPKTDDQGSNCNCQNDVYRENNPERCVDSIVVEPDPGTVSGPEPEPVICNDEGSTTFGQEGMCGPCKEGFSKVGKRCVEDITRPGPKPEPGPGPEPEPVICNDEGSTTYGQEGVCGPCKEGFSKVGKLCVEDVTRPKPEPDPDPEPNPCDDKKYAEDNPLQCGGVIEPDPDPEPNPCDDKKYAEDNPLQCGGVIEPDPDPEPNPCDDKKYAEDNPLQCGGVIEPEPDPDPEPNPCLNPGFAAANPILCGELEPEPEPEPEPCPPGQALGVDGVCIDVPPGGGAAGGGGGAGGTDLGMLTGGVDWARQPFVAVEYRAPTKAIDVLNQFVENEIKSSLFS